jgi:4-amino-4-deoxy-L-arabinose transferase-like glycosyltransferase
MNKFFLIIIFLISASIRFISLTHYPIHYSIDEVAIGESGYWIANTARDEYNQFLPLAFHSVGDYKPPVNIYLTAISIKIFGFNEFAVRFPSALLGSLTPIVLIYLLLALGFNKNASYLGGLWLSLSPWHIIYSRASFEAITALFFFVLAFWQFLVWIKNKRQINALISASSFSLSLWAYHSQRVLVPLFVLFLIYFYRKQILSSHKSIHQFLNFILLTLIFALPFIYLTLFTPVISQRAASTSILREQSLVQILHHGNYQNLKYFIFDNDKYLIFRHWAAKFLNYFDLRFWFFKGLGLTPPGYPGLGLLYLFDLPLIFLGLFALIKNKNNSSTVALVLFLIGPLAASFTMNEQHPLRSLPFILFFALTITKAYEYLLKTRPFYLLPYFLLIFINFFYFVKIYTKAFPYFYSTAWQYGYKQASLYACEHQNDYNKIFISETFGESAEFTSIPHYFLAFYCGGKPVDYITDNPINAPNGIYVKRPLWAVDKNNYKNSLFIAAPFDFPADLDQSKIVKTISYPNGRTAFLFVTTKN